MATNRLVRFNKSCGIPADYLAIERARADRMERRAVQLKAERDELAKLVSRIVPGDPLWPEARAILTRKPHENDA